MKWKLNVTDDCTAIYRLIVRRNRVPGSEILKGVEFRGLKFRGPKYYTTSLRCFIPFVFKYAKQRRILMSQNTTVYIC